MVKISCGIEHSMALSKQSELDSEIRLHISDQVQMQVYSWGNGFQSKLGHGDNENLYEPLFLESNHNFIDICAGHNHSAGIDEDNNLIVWGPLKYFGLQIL